MFFLSQFSRQPINATPSVPVWCRKTFEKSFVPRRWVETIKACVQIAVEARRGSLDSARTCSLNGYGYRDADFLHLVNLTFPEVDSEDVTILIVAKAF